MSQIHVIIATYGGRCERRYDNGGDLMLKERFLRYNVGILNQFSSHIGRITIMKPQIHHNHKIIKDYYNFDNIDISNIKDKMYVVECANRGISYGQLLTAMYATKDDFDYHIFLEDDYTLFHDDASLLLVQEYEKQRHVCGCDHLFLTLGICKNNAIGDKQARIYNYLQHRLSKLDGTEVDTHIPDFSIGIINKLSVQKIFDDHDRDLEKVLCTFNNVTGGAHKFQILFGEILCKSGITVRDADDYLAVFWDKQRKTVRFVNLITDYLDIKLRAFDPSEKIYKCPLVIPLDILHHPYRTDDHIKQYITEELTFEKNMTIIQSLLRGA